MTYSNDPSHRQSTMDPPIPANPGHNPSRRSFRAIADVVASIGGFLLVSHFAMQTPQDSENIYEHDVLKTVIIEEPIVNVTTIWDAGTTAPVWEEFPYMALISLLATLFKPSTYCNLTLAFILQKTAYLFYTYFYIYLFPSTDPSIRATQEYMLLSLAMNPYLIYTYLELPLGIWALFTRGDTKPLRNYVRCWYLGPIYFVWAVLKRDWNAHELVVIVEPCRFLRALCRRDWDTPQLRQVIGFARGVRAWKLWEQRPAAVDNIEDVDDDAASTADNDDEITAQSTSPAPDEFEKEMKGAVQTFTTRSFWDSCPSIGPPRRPDDPEPLPAAIITFVVFVFESIKPFTAAQMATPQPLDDVQEALASRGTIAETRPSVMFSGFTTMTFWFSNPFDAGFAEEDDETEAAGGKVVGIKTRRLSPLPDTLAVSKGIDGGIVRGRNKAHDIGVTALVTLTLLQAPLRRHPIYRQPRFIDHRNSHVRPPPFAIAPPPAGILHLPCLAAQLPPVAATPSRLLTTTPPSVSAEVIPAAGGPAASLLPAVEKLASSDEASPPAASDTFPPLPPAFLQTQGLIPPHLRPTTTMLPSPLLFPTRLPPPSLLQNLPSQVSPPPTLAN